MVYFLSKGLTFLPLCGYLEASLGEILEERETLWFGVVV